MKLLPARVAALGISERNLAVAAGLEPATTGLTTRCWDEAPRTALLAEDRYWRQKLHKEGTSRHARFHRSLRCDARRRRIGQNFCRRRSMVDWSVLAVEVPAEAAELDRWSRRADLHAVVVLLDPRAASDPKLLSFLDCFIERARSIGFGLFVHVRTPLFENESQIHPTIRKLRDELQLAVGRSLSDTLDEAETFVGACARFYWLLGWNDCASAVPPSPGGSPHSSRRPLRSRWCCSGSRRSQDRNGARPSPGLSTLDWSASSPVSRGHPRCTSRSSSFSTCASPCA
jgi:hypothetical protein